MWIFYKSKDRRSEENEVSLWVNGISGLMLLPSYKKLDELEYGFVYKKYKRKTKIKDCTAT